VVLCSALEARVAACRFDIRSIIVRRREGRDDEAGSELLGRLGLYFANRSCGVTFRDLTFSGILKEKET
jgi:hypothetical protein